MTSQTDNRIMMYRKFDLNICTFFAQKKTLQMVLQKALFKNRRNIKLGADAAPGLYRKQ